jgi:hypothetical protein
LRETHFQASRSRPFPWTKSEDYDEDDDF